MFLLNKNVEMVCYFLWDYECLIYYFQLMGERDLRALDMRHTLPNLKNLLLTLSHGAVSKPLYVLIRFVLLKTKNKLGLQDRGHLQ